MTEHIEHETSVADRSRRTTLIRLGTYAAFTPPAMAALLTVTKSTAYASSGCSRQNPGNNKCVGNAPFDGERGEVPSGRPRP